MIPADGFFEWHHINIKDKHYPYYIYMKDHSNFSLAGLWNDWIKPETEETLRTYTILKRVANDLLAKSHNNKKRMPVIIPRDSEDA